MFPFGAVVLTRFPFTGLSGDKRRPALVISRDNPGDFVVCFITSIARTGPHSAPLAATSGTGLKVPSWVRFDKLAALNRTVIAGRLGEAPGDWLTAHRAAFFDVLGSASLAPQGRRFGHPAARGSACPGFRGLQDAKPPPQRSVRTGWRRHHRPLGGYGSCGGASLHSVLVARSISTASAVSRANPAACASSSRSFKRRRSQSWRGVSIISAGLRRERPHG